MGRGWLIDLGRKHAFAALGALRTIGSWVWSIQPLFQSIFGWVAANQGYPSIALCSPSSVRKNLMLVVVDLVRNPRSVPSRRRPALASQPSTLHSSPGGELSFTAS